MLARIIEIDLILNYLFGFSKNFLILERNTRIGLAPPPWMGAVLPLSEFRSCFLELYIVVQRFFNRVIIDL